MSGLDMALGEGASPEAIARCSLLPDTVIFLLKDRLRTVVLQKAGAEVQTSPELYLRLQSYYSGQIDMLSELINQSESLKQSAAIE